MRYVRIFFLHFERVLQYRLQVFVWFLISFFNTFIFLLFWRGAYSSSDIFHTWNLPSVTAYYYILLVAGGFLFVHVDADSYEDIQEGYLSSYLIRPFSYFAFKFMSELPWRLIQGIMASVAILLLFSIYHTSVNIPFSLGWLFAVIIITILGYLLMYVFKMIVLLSGLWITDLGGLRQLIEIIILIFAGFVVTLHFLPEVISHVTFLLPFAYMIYYPVIIFLGNIHVSDAYGVVATQLIWIILLLFLYQLLWKLGIKKFTGVGQ